MRAFIFLFLQTSLLFAHANLEDYFKDFNTSGVFVLVKNENPLKYLSNDFSRANERFSPASTFKIYHSLIALESKTLKDSDEIFYIYKGEKVFLSSWQSNANLKSAFKKSQVPAFKSLARKLGLEKFKYYLLGLNYGNVKNLDFSTLVLDNFWLDNTLQISALEQVEQLRALLSFENTYFDKAHIKTLKELMRLETRGDFILYAKTGFYEKENLAWFVGFSKNTHNKTSCIFALNANLSYQNLALKEQIAKLYLKKLGCYN